MPDQLAVPVVTRVLADPVRMYLPSVYWNRARDWFAIPLDFNTLAAGAVGTPQTFTIQNDSDFLCLALWAHATTAAAGTAEQAEQNFLIAISDSSSGASWFGATDGTQGGVAHLMNVAGARQRAVAGAVGSGWLVHPRFVPGASTVQVALTNLDAGNARRVFLLFEGVKIYRAIRQGA